jgi:hypothetical protein
MVHVETRMVPHVAAQSALGRHLSSFHQPRTSPTRPKLDPWSTQDHLISTRTQQDTLDSVYLDMALPEHHSTT